AQNWLTIQSVSGDSDIAKAKSASGVDRSHSVILNKRSPIRVLSSPATPPPRLARRRQVPSLANQAPAGESFTVTPEVTPRYGAQPGDGFDATHAGRPANPLRQAPDATRLILSGARRAP